MVDATGGDHLQGMSEVLWACSQPSEDHPIEAVSGNDGVLLQGLCLATVGVEEFCARLCAHASQPGGCGGCASAQD